jgi:monoterpene epsilon-lactone hydrolase
MHIVGNLLITIILASFAAHALAADRLLPSTISKQARDYIEKNEPSALAPKTIEEWREAMASPNKPGELSNEVKRLLELWPVELELLEIDGARHLLVTPKNLAASNDKRIVLYAHGGAYVFGSPEDQLGALARIADVMQVRVLGLRYPLAWQKPHPAARDRMVAVYRELLKTYSPRHIAMAGDSAGGGLVMSSVLKIRDDGLLMPAVLGLISPWADISKTGDSMVVASGHDPLIDYDKNLAAAAKLYADGLSLKDPNVSPIYADFGKGFPPTYISSGTRDHFLSHTSRLQRRLTDAGVTNRLFVYEGMWHVFQIAPPVIPEAGPAWRDFANFLNSHLAR